jgi:hypothetical protein
MSSIVKIDLDETGPSKSAVIHFEKPSAAKTALMVRLSFVSESGWYHSTLMIQLNESLLDGSHLTVNSDTVHPDEDLGTSPVPGAPLEQSDKPRAGSKGHCVLSVADSNWLFSNSCRGIFGQRLQALGSDFAACNSS